ncbi:MAG: hypothetical protein ACTHNP_12440 [Solirubrobacterales bacterium]
MKNVRRRLPLLRRMSPFQQGISLAAGWVLLWSLILAVINPALVRHLRQQTLSDVAQVGATLLVAYAVEMSWLVKRSLKRGGNTERWIGVVVGLGSSGVMGIIITLALVNHPVGSLDLVERFAATWALFSLGLLALLIASLPYFLYEVGHSLNTEYPDE